MKWVPVTQIFLYCLFSDAGESSSSDDNQVVEDFILDQEVLQDVDTDNEVFDDIIIGQELPQEENVGHGIIEGRGRSRQRRTRKAEQRKISLSLGREYVTATGITRPEKEVQANPCTDKKCQYKCGIMWSEQQRQSVFDSYWRSGSYQRQTDFITSHIVKVSSERKYTKKAVSRRLNTYQYFLDTNGQKIQVCKQFFLATLNIKQRTVYYTLNNANQGMSKLDARGRHRPHNKTTEEKLEFASSYIEGLHWYSPAEERQVWHMREF